MSAARLQFARVGRRQHDSGGAGSERLGAVAGVGEEGELVGAGRCQWRQTAHDTIGRSDYVSLQPAAAQSSNRGVQFSQLQFSRRPRARRHAG
jgi:hypothetical protein